MAIVKSDTEQDKLCIAAWQKLIAEFKVIQTHYKGKDDNIKLIQLKEKAKLNPYLTDRQIEGIYARCDNVMNGTYGNTKTNENYEHGKPSSKSNGVAK